MSWLQRAEPILLHQESSIPYVVFDDKVFLCYSNIYSQEKTSSEDYSISFKCNRSQIMRQSASYYRLKTFPISIPLSDIVSFVAPKFTVQEEITKGDPKNIAIVRSNFVRKLRSRAIQDLYETLESFDKSFILTKDDIDANTRLLEEIAIPIFHENSDWGRTCVHVANEMCENSYRSINWTKNVPNLEISCYGLMDTRYIDEITKIFEKMQIDATTSWEF